MNPFLKSVLAGWALGLVISAGSAFAFAAEPAAAPLVLENLEREALENNPSLAAAEARWQEAQKKIAVSWALPDPTAGMDLMGSEVETRTGPQMQNFEITQEIPFPAKLWKKRAAAKAEAESAKSEYLAVRRALIRDVRKTFYELYGVDEALSTLEEIRSVLNKFEGVAQARYANRSGAQRDAAKAQAEVSLTLEQNYILIQQREALTARLKVLLNRGPFEELGSAEKPVKPEVKETFIELLNQAIEKRDEIKKMEALLEKSRAEKSLAVMQNLPDLNAGFRYTRVGSGMTTDPEDGKDSWMFPLSITVPLWQNRIVPEILASGKAVDAAAAEVHAVRNETFYEVREAYTRFEAGSTVALLYETAVLPQAKLALTTDQSAYESGSAGFLELLDSQRVYLNARLAYARIYTELLKSHADLEWASGADLTGGES